MRQRISNVRFAVALGGRGQALSAGDDGTVRLWHLDSGREVRHFAGYHGGVMAVAALARARGGAPGARRCG